MPYIVSYLRPWGCTVFRRGLARLLSDLPTEDRSVFDIEQKRLALNQP